MAQLEPENRQPEREVSRIVAGMLAAVLVLHAVNALFTGIVFGGAGSRSFFDRSVNPELYWIYMSLGLTAIVYLASIAIGWVPSKHDPLRFERRRKRRQVDASMMGLIGCVVLAYYWFMERPATGISQGHSIFGFGIIALLGFICVFAPAPHGRFSVTLKTAGIILMGGAFVACYYV
jgi:hypothetical protein